MPGYHQLMVFAVIAGALLVLVVSQTWLQAMINVRLREWLTHDLLDQWLVRKRVYLLGFAGEIGVNPDQRIQQDAQHLTELTTILAIGLLQSSLLLTSFAGMLWVASNQVVFDLGNGPVSIPGYMVWCALAYSAGGSLLASHVGRPLIPLDAERCAREADLARLVASTSAPTALSCTMARQRFAACSEPLDGMVTLMTRAGAAALARLTSITSASGWLAPVLPSRPSVGRALDPTRRGRGRRDFEDYRAALFAAVGSSRTAPRLQALGTRCSSRRSATSWGFTSTRQIMRSSSRSMRKARSRRSSAPNRFCRWVRLRRRHHPRLQAARYDHTVYRPRRRQRAGALAQCKARHRHQEFLAFLNTSTRTCQLGWTPPHRRQLRHPQAPEGPRLARRAGALPCPLHADLRVVAEPGRALVRAPDPPRNPPWLLRQRQGSGRRDQDFVAAYNARSQPFTWTATADHILAKLANFVTLFLGHYTSRLHILVDADTECGLGTQGSAICIILRDHQPVPLALRPQATQPALAVESQEVVVWQAETRDGGVAGEAGVGSMPVVVVQPRWQGGGPCGGGSVGRGVGSTRAAAVWMKRSALPLSGMMTAVPDDLRSRSVSGYGATIRDMGYRSRKVRAGRRVDHEL